MITAEELVTVECGPLYLLIKVELEVYHVY